MPCVAATPSSAADGPDAHRLLSLPKPGARLPTGRFAGGRPRAAGHLTERTRSVSPVVGFPRPGSDRYGSDVLAAGGAPSHPARASSRTVDAVRDLVVEEVMTGWCGAVVRADRDLHTVELEDRLNRRRTFPLGPGFLIEGKPVSLRAPVRKQRATPTHTASGSVAVTTDRARVARASRIFVEGRHDAELVEKVWGADLRVEGVVVEYLEGADDLGDHLAAFGPGATRKAGVLLDHLVPGSKESRIADAVRGRHRGHVLIVGHPYVDIWQAVKPQRVGLEAWPSVPRSVPWKRGICTVLGWPHRNQTDIAQAWQRILSTVSTYADLEPALLGRVEELIDFVTAQEAG